jgi:hypothetical protein
MFHYFIECHPKLWFVAEKRLSSADALRKAANAPVEQSVRFVVSAVIPHTRNAHK